MAEFTNPKAKLECSYLTKVVKEQRNFSLIIRLKFHFSHMLKFETLFKVVFKGNNLIFWRKLLCSLLLLSSFRSKSLNCWFILEKNISDVLTYSMYPKNDDFERRLERALISELKTRTRIM